MFILRGKGLAWAKSQITRVPWFIFFGKHHIYTHIIPKEDILGKQ